MAGFLPLFASLWVTAAGTICGTDTACQLNMATQFAPVLRLDKATITEARCLPGHPETVYWQRKQNNTDIICESDITKLEQGEVPMFYQYEECANASIAIHYHIWYSHQPACLKIDLGPVHDEEYGAHKGDWETVGVYIRSDRVERIRFHQHSGSYTRARGSFELVEDTEHPVVYVGSDSHGSYHDQGGAGNCAYFQDYRRWEDPSLKLEGWKFLLAVRNESDNLPEWFKADRIFFDGYSAPGNLNHYGCFSEMCDGKDDYVSVAGTCAGKTCGCWKSHWCDNVVFGDPRDPEPCDQSLLNDVMDKGKDLFGGFMDAWNSAQVSRADRRMACATALLLLSISFAAGLLW